MQTLNNPHTLVIMLGQLLGNPDMIASLVNLGAAGAVIIITVIFLKFIREERRALVKEIRELINAFNKHDEWEHTMMANMQRTILRKQMIEKRKKPNA